MRKLPGLNALLFFLLFCPAVSAQIFNGRELGMRERKSSSPVKFVYDVDFDYYLDNCEYDTNHERFSVSQTFHAARLSPVIGLRIDQGRRMSHSVYSGIDIMKNMGEYPVSASDKGLQNTNLFREMTLWYALSSEFGQGRTFQMRAGIFPKKYSVFGMGTPMLDGKFPLAEAERVSTLFESESNRFYDNNMEGLLVNIVTDRNYFEAGLDWMGMIGHGRREQFRFFTFGSMGVGDSPFKAGWTASYVHYANSLEVIGVVDNLTASPWAGWFDKIGKVDVGIRAAYVAGYHRDRKGGTEARIPHGVQLAAAMNFKGFGIMNEAYYGMSQMPYYGMTDTEGNIYAGHLYSGNPFYRINTDEDWNHSGFYDRLELYWERNFTDFVGLRAGCTFHFTDRSFEGWQQQLSLVFNLERALNKKTRPGKQRYIEFSL